MKVKDLIELLSKYDPEREVYNWMFDPIETVYESEWTDRNYPYDLPNEMRIIIE